MGTEAATEIFAVDPFSFTIDQTKRRHTTLAVRRGVPVRTASLAHPDLKPANVLLMVAADALQIAEHVDVVLEDAAVPSMSLRPDEEPIQATPSTEEFSRLADRWRRETAHYPLASRRLSHDAFLEILTLGRGALPLIIEDLRKTRDHWFTALRLFAKENPAAGAATHSDAVDAWLRWWDTRHERNVPQR